MKCSRSDLFIPNRHANKRERRTSRFYFYLRLWRTIQNDEGPLVLIAQGGNRNAKVSREGELSERFPFGYRHTFGHGPADQAQVFGPWAIVLSCSSVRNELYEL